MVGKIYVTNNVHKKWWVKCETTSKYFKLKSVSRNIFPWLFGAVSAVSLQIVFYYIFLTQTSEQLDNVKILQDYFM